MLYLMTFEKPYGGKQARRCHSWGTVPQTPPAMAAVQAGLQGYEVGHKQEGGERQHVMGMHTILIPCSNCGKIQEETWFQA